jgi:peptidoglycan/xylan/chitin deacetylase (PgdA/CDA1 family)
MMALFAPRPSGQWLAAAVALGVAAVVFWWPRKAWAGAKLPTRVLAVAIVGGAALGTYSTPLGLLTVLFAPAAAFGAALLCPSGWPRLRALAGLLLAAVVVVVGTEFGGAAGLVVIVGVCVPSALSPRSGIKGRPTSHAFLIGSGVLLAVLLAWEGATEPAIRWFGAAATHGDRHGNQVALTFDDGPNDAFSPQIAAILESHGATGTFFMVGKAVDRSPATARLLLAHGHLLANHSYEHDGWRWLDPAYPELTRAEHAIKTATGVCPAFYRPPHGQRTPFVSRVVADHGMHTVLWDTSAGDWNATDPAAVVKVLLERVRPGSIIVLHDGLDGLAGKDRSVLVKALPGILDGLAAKGLHPVRLDTLLGLGGYRLDC